MAFCSNCGTQLPENAGFCPSCGAKNSSLSVEIPAAEPIAAAELPVAEPFIPEQPVYAAPVEKAQPTYQPPVQEPVYQQPTYQPPVYSYQQPVSQAQPVASTAAKVKGFIGMGFGIFAFFWAVLDFFMSFSGLASLGSYDSEEIGVAVFVYGFLTIAFAIPGKILSSKAIDGGFVGTPAKLGNVFSLIGIIVGAVTAFIGFLCIIV